MLEKRLPGGHADPCRILHDIPRVIVQVPAGIPVVAELVVVPEHELRYFGVEAPDVLVEQVADLLATGRARAWGTGMWTAAQHHAALDICGRTGVPGPCAAQMATSLADHAAPTDPEICEACQ